MTLMPTFARFMRADPEGRLELDFTDRLVDVIEAGYDTTSWFAPATSRIPD